MDEFLQKIAADNSDILIFRSDRDKEQWIQKIKSQFQKSGNEFLASKTRAAISQADLSQTAIAMARDFIKSKSLSKYIPGVIDPRTSSQRAEASKEVEKVLDFYFDKLGFKFKNEHLGDTRLRTSLKSQISGSYLYEGSGQDGEIIFRRHKDGFFGPALNPEKLLHQVAAPYLDEKRTLEAQKNKQQEYRKTAAERMTLPPDSPKYAEAIKNETESLRTQDIKAYSTKRLPVKSFDFYHNELKLRTAHKLGITDMRMATQHELMKIDGEAKNAVQELEQIPKIEIEGPDMPVEHWPGFDDTANNSGVYLTNDQL